MTEVAIKFKIIVTGIALLALWPLSSRSRKDSAIAADVPAAGSQDSIVSADFGKTRDGTAVQIYTLHNRRGMEARIASYGGIVTTLTAPDRHGQYADVVLGFDKLEDYIAHPAPFFGAMVGRYANRIANAQFKLDGVTYNLIASDGPNALHGGPIGFDKQVWHVESADVTPKGPRLVLSHVSPDGDQGYPGTLHVTATYTLTEDNALRLDYAATTDRDTIINLTQHSYFNLRARGDVLGHLLQINADRYTPGDNTEIPTGELRAVAGTPFDFRHPTAIGAHIDDADEQIRIGHGYDHNWVITKAPAALGVAAVVYEPESGRVLEVSSTAPGVQFYSANGLDGSLRGKGGVMYGRRSGLALEAEAFPDTPNHPKFPSAELKAGQTYHNTIIFRLYAR
jgi:aldose 1-epimerase